MIAAPKARYRPKSRISASRPGGTALYRPLSRQTVASERVQATLHRTPPRRNSPRHAPASTATRPTTTPATMHWTTVGHDGMDPPTWWLSAALLDNMRAELDHFAEVNPQHTRNSDEPGVTTLRAIVTRSVTRSRPPAGTVTSPTTSTSNWWRAASGGLRAV